MKKYAIILFLFCGIVTAVAPFDVFPPSKAGEHKYPLAPTKNMDFESVTIEATAGNYTFIEDSTDYLALYTEDAGVDNYFSSYTADGDGTDVTALRLYGYGTLSSIVDEHHMSILWATAGQYEIFTGWTDSAATTREQDLVLYTYSSAGSANTDQLKLSHTGSLSISGSLTVAANSDIGLSGTGNVTSGSEGFIVGTLTITDGSIDDTDGTIAFGDTAFSGVGTIGCGAITATGNLVIPDNGRIGSVGTPHAFHINSNGSVEFQDCLSAYTITFPGAGGSMSGTDIDISVTTGNYLSTGDVGCATVTCTDGATFGGDITCTKITLDGTAVLDTFASHSLKYGELAGEQATGNNCLFFGYRAGYGLGVGITNSGAMNVGLGANALLNNRAGLGNLAIGSDSLYYNQGGSYSVGVGISSLSKNLAGANIGVGYYTLGEKANGPYNVAIGHAAGWKHSGGAVNMTECDRCVLIGANTDLSAATGITNSIVIGYEAIGHGSNTVTIGNSSITDNYFFGNITCTKRISSGTMTITSSSDTTDVSGVNTLFVDTTSGDVTLGGLVGGVDGQYLFIVKIVAANDLILEHEEGIGGDTDDFFMHQLADETIDSGGVPMVFNGTKWFDCSHAKHV